MYWRTTFVRSYSEMWHFECACPFTFDHILPHIQLMSLTSSQLLAASLISFTVYVLLSRKRRHPFPFPPGPKSLPVIGNLRDIPFKYQWLTYEKWGREIGKCILFLHMSIVHFLYIGSDIVHAEFLGIHVVVLNSEKAATDLLEKRSSIYSDRYSCPLVASPLRFIT